MPDIVLKDRSGNDRTYPGIKAIMLVTPDGDTTGFTSGETIDTEEVTVAIDFGDYISVEDPAAMDELLSSRDNIGKYVRYVGTDCEYTKGQAYKICDAYEAFDSADCSEATVEVTSGTELTATIECKVGDLIIAAFAIRSPLVSLSDGWTLISTSQSTTDINEADTYKQTLSFAYKYAETTTESITVVQETAGRLYINMVSFSNAVGFTDTGYQYQKNAEIADPTSATFNRPDGKLVLWGVTRSIWTTNLFWSMSNDSRVIQLAPTPRLLLAIDESENESVIITSGVATTTDAYICGALVIELTQFPILKAVNTSELPIFDSQIVESDEGVAMSKVTICKPETLIPENIVRGADVAGIVGTGYSTDHVIKYMSIDGTENLYTKHIMHGDTAGDVIALGLIAEPIINIEGKVHTFLGWSDSIGGDVKTSIFETVTEDRTVYAVYKVLAILASGDCGTNAKWRLTDDGTLTIYGTGAMADYSGASGQPWYSYSSQIRSAVIEQGITKIGNQSLRQLTNLTSVNIADSVTALGMSVFLGCNSLRTIELPDSITTIGAYCFNETGLTSITIPEKVTSITYCFYACYYLTTVNLPSNLTSIGDNTFYLASALQKITIPASVTSIGKNAFNGCSSLNSVTFKNTTGWYVSTSSTATSGTNVTVTNTSTAATYLRSTYRTYYWKRK